jgi:hypothetical protein
MPSFALGMNKPIASGWMVDCTIERGLFDPELVPEELTQLRMGKIIKDKYPERDDEDQEAVRQHAVAALNFTQKANRRPRLEVRRLERAGMEKRASTPHSLRLPKEAARTMVRYCLRDLRWVASQCDDIAVRRERVEHVRTVVRLGATG